MGEMSEDSPPYRKAPDVSKISQMDQVRKALEVYKSWIWGDGIEIAKLRTRMKSLEKELEELREIVNRSLTGRVN